MTSQTAEKPRRVGKPKGKGADKSAAKGPPPALNIKVDFGSVSLGDQTARLGFSVERNTLNIDAADEALCGKRLIGTVVCHPISDDQNQTYLVEGFQHKVRGAFDVKGFRVSPNLIAAGLTFQKGSINVEELSNFAKQSGRLIIDRIEQLEAGELGEDEGEGDSEEEA